MAVETGPATLSPLAYPPSTFAKLEPASYLRAHLQPADGKGSPVRPSGRAPLESRTPSVHTGSLSHSNGSAVVRLGDTAIVCGIRAEILRAQDIPHEYRPLASPDTTSERGNDDESDEVSTLGLLVPNLELSTGCSPAHLPGNPPSTLAQSLTHRIHSLLHSTKILGAVDLRITTLEAISPDEDIESAEKRAVVKAYWTLYIDTMVISHDGSVFDTAWLAILAALRDVRLPEAHWDADREQVVCSPQADEGRHLSLRGLPVAMTFGVFETGNRRRGIEGESWVLADMDNFEEGMCEETVTVVVDGHAIRNVVKTGGVVVDSKQMEAAAKMAHGRWSEWQQLLAQHER